MPNQRTNRIAAGHGQPISDSRLAAEQLWREICRHLAPAAAGIRYQTDGVAHLDRSRG